MEKKTFVIRYFENNKVIDVIWYAIDEDTAFESFRNSFVGKDFEKVAYVKVYCLEQIPYILWMSTVE